jgi:galactose-1-phosphate uridylyltransferase
VPNLYPAFARHEVVIHAPRHVRTLAELDAEELGALTRTWIARAAAARAEGFATVQLIVNEGREAGASRAHGHSQLAWLADDPPQPRAELTRAGACGVCEVLARDGKALAVAERDGVVLLCPAASRAPYELLIAPREHEPEAWRSGRFGAAVSLLAEGIRRLHRAEGETAVNAWLHTAPFRADDGHWHLEAVPRVTALGGFELGADVWINVLAPADAAEALRAAG